jgi:membrane protein
VKTLFTLFKRTFQEYGADNCSHMAAAISYYVIFSVVPLTVFLLSIFGFVVRSESVREDVSDAIVEFAGIEVGDRRLEPDVAVLSTKFDADTVRAIEAELAGLSDAEQERMAAVLEDEGRPVLVAGQLLGADELKVRSDNLVTDTLRGVSNVSAPLTIVGLIGMAWSASAMFGAIRKSINIAWDLEKHRPVVQQKLIDVGMVLGLGLLLGLSVAGTAAIRTLPALSDENLGPLSEGTGFAWSVLPLFLPAFFSFTVFLLMYRYVPNVQTKIGDVWPGALLATVLFELLKNGFAFYIANFNNYSGAYGALGGLLLFMLWMYLTSNILLIGAELAAEYPRVLRGDYADEEARPAERRPLRDTVRRAVRGVFVHRRDDPEDSDPGGDADAKS